MEFVDYTDENKTLNYFILSMKNAKMVFCTGANVKKLFTAVSYDFS